MQSFSRKLQRLSLLALSSVLLSVFLVACGSDSSSTTTNSAPAPTQAASSNTSQSDSNTSQSDSSLQTYKGNGFTIGYPKDWKVTEKSAAGEVSFASPAGDYNLLVSIGDNSSGADAATLLQKDIERFKQNVSNLQDRAIAPTATLAGETWNEQAFDSDSATTVLMQTTHGSSACVITYVGVKDGFDQGNQSYFQPMLQSFTFSS